MGSSEGDGLRGPGEAKVREEEEAEGRDIVGMMENDHQSPVVINSRPRALGLPRPEY